MKPEREPLAHRVVGELRMLTADTIGPGAWPGLLVDLLLGLLVLVEDLRTAADMIEKAGYPGQREGFVWGLRFVATTIEEDVLGSRS